ncbi:MAG: DUF362 domain-containing protein [Candidatus Thorarchaeota archaeon]|nr:DUF362 domain-containing protein [Candidatus Thorarchaeota archaeon]
MDKNEDVSKDCRYKKKNRRLFVLGLVAIASAFWILLRTGRKPTRVFYPCQQVSLVNIQVFKVALLASIPSIASLRSSLSPLKPIAVLAVLFVGSAAIINDSTMTMLGFSLAADDDYTRIPLDIQPLTSLSPEDSSDLFVVQNASSLEGDMNPAVDTLISMMASEGLHFYKTVTEPTGLIGSDNVIILKVNGQWSYRGGTNTDLIKSVIEAILDHPDGFTGEIVIADNGQGLGNLDWLFANAFNHSQAATDVAQSFPVEQVSTFLWDDLRPYTVDDYDEVDFADGYVLSSDWNNETQMFVSYPKFQTSNGVYLSFKNGVWENGTGFDSDRLKVINMPVLKTHMRYGVTASVKHYMGVPKGHIVSSVDPGIPHEHFSIALGGMGTLMVETRAPILNILDMIWVNPHPLESSERRGPWSTYTSAKFTDIIGVSQDPVALDYWSTKNVLIPTAAYLGYTEFSSLDPDYEPLSDPFIGSQGMDESFANYLHRSEDVLRDAGFQVTTNTSEMNVFVSEMSGNPPGTSTNEPDPGFILDPVMLAIAIPLSAGIIVLAAVMARRRN